MTQAAAPPPTRLTFGPFTLDPETGRLLEGDRVIPLAPKPFETLLYLARRPGRVVSKNELIERLWADTFVTDDVLVQCVVDIRRALGEPAKSPRYLQTIPRRGYQFLGQVTPAEPAAPPAPAPARPGPPDPAASTTVAQAPIPTAAPAPPESPARWSKRRLAAAAALAAMVMGALAFASRAWWRPADARAVEGGSLVVMPVAVESPTPQTAWLRQGLAEMIRAQVGQTPGIRVIARHRVTSMLAEAGHDETGPSPEGAEVIAKRLQAERLVTGSFVLLDGRFALTAQVLDVGTGRTEGTASVRGQYPRDLLDGVDELCLKLMHHLRANPTAPPSWRPTHLTTRSLEASRFYTEALTHFARGGRQGGEDAEARLDPSFAQAYVKKAEVQQWRNHWGYGSPDPAPAMQAAARLLKELPERERLLVESFHALIASRPARSSSGALSCSSIPRTHRRSASPGWWRIRS